MKPVWVQTTLGEIAEIVSGATPSTSVKEYWDGDIRWVTPKDLSDLDGSEISHTARSISVAGLRSCAASVLPANSVLLSSRAPIGLVAINRVPMATNQGFKSLVPDPRRVDSRFLYWWLKKHRPLLESLGNGATFKEISKKSTAAVPISLPPIEEQRRIAAILDAADALRAKRRQALDKLDTLTQSIFIDMFGREPATTKLSDLLSSAHLFKDGDWVESKDQDPEGTVRLTQLADVGVGSWINKSRRYMTAERAKALKCTFLEAGDVLVARMPDPIGRACVFPGDPMPAVTAVDVCIIRPSALTLNARWLVEVLNLPATLRQVNALAVGATRQRVSRSNLAKVKLPQVEVARQRIFAERAANVDSLRVRCAAALTEMDRLFGSLQHRAFMGEL